MCGWGFRYILQRLDSAFTLKQIGYLVMNSYFEKSLFNELLAYKRRILSSAVNLCQQFDPDQARQNVGHDLGLNCLTPR